MRKFTYLFIIILLLINCTNTKKTKSANSKLSAIMEDYILYEGKTKNLSYTLVSYAPIEEWFREKAKGKNDEEVISLYEQLPLIGDLDNFDKSPLEKRKEYILQISETILENNKAYKEINSISHETAVDAMNKTFQFYNDLFPEQEMDIMLILNPFFPNGGMGAFTNKEDGTKQGRLEIGIAILSHLENVDFEVFIAHEFTHIVHQYLGAKDLMAIEDRWEDDPSLTEEIPLFTEGIASYYSAVIMNKTENLVDTFFYSSYASGPIRNPHFIQTVAQKYLEDVAGRPVNLELHRAWFGSKSDPKIRPFEQYQAIGYFLGYHIVKNLIDSGKYTMKTLLEQPVLTMQKEMKGEIIAFLKTKK